MFSRNNNFKSKPNFQAPINHQTPPECCQLAGYTVDEFGLRWEAKRHTAFPDAYSVTNAAGHPKAPSPLLRSLMARAASHLLRKARFSLPYRATAQTGNGGSLQNLVLIPGQIICGHQ